MENNPAITPAGASIPAAPADGPTALLQQQLHGAAEEIQTDAPVSPSNTDIIEDEQQGQDGSLSEGADEPAAPLVDPTAAKRKWLRKMRAATDELLHSTDEATVSRFLQRRIDQLQQHADTAATDHQQRRALAAVQQARKDLESVTRVGVLVMMVDHTGKVR
jgi:ribosomal protein S15P/S13E